MAKQGNDALRAGMSTALKRRIRSRSDFVVLLAWSRTFFAACLADRTWLYAPAWLLKKAPV